MQRHNAQSIGDVLRDLLEQTALQNRMDELKAAELWSRVVGSKLASVCSKPTVKKGVMTVGVPNASLRNEFLMNRSSIRQLINRMIGKEIITEIKFVS